MNGEALVVSLEWTIYGFSGETKLLYRRHKSRRGCLMMMIAFITFKSSLVPLFEGL